MMRLESKHKCEKRENAKETVPAEKWQPRVAEAGHGAGAETQAASRDRNAEWRRQPHCGQTRPENDDLADCADSKTKHRIHR